MRSPADAPPPMNTFSLLIRALALDLGVNLALARPATPADRASSRGAAPRMKRNGRRRHR